MKKPNKEYNGYYKNKQQIEPQILIENFTDISEGNLGGINRLRESTNNGKEIEDMIDRISFSGDDLSDPSDEE
jgi:hypothetical protein